MASVVQTRFAAARAVPTTVLAPLPSWFVHDVLLLLPVDTRLRCVELNRAWRALLADTRFWTCLNLTASGGVTRLSLGLLRAAVAKARGQLRALDVCCLQLRALDVCCLVKDLCTILFGNKDTLSELRLHRNILYAEPAEFLPLLERFGRLECFEVNTMALQQNTVQDVLFLKKAPPYGPLRVSRLEVWARDYVSYGPTFFPDLIQHTSLNELCLTDITLTTADERRAFVDAAIELKLEVVKLYWTRVTHLLLPELTRLVSAGTIRELEIVCAAEATYLFEDAASTIAFCDAVRASKMKRLVLEGIHSPLKVKAVIMVLRKSRVQIEYLS